MKAYVYLVGIIDSESWYANITIEPSIDQRFWLQDEISGALAANEEQERLNRLESRLTGMRENKGAVVQRKGKDVERGGNVQIDSNPSGWEAAVDLRLKGDRTKAMFFWREALPLGDARRSITIWEETIPAAGSVSEERALAFLEFCIGQAKRESAEGIWLGNRKGPKSGDGIIGSITGALGKRAWKNIAAGEVLDCSEERKRGRRRNKDKETVRNRKGADGQGILRKEVKPSEGWIRASGSGEDKGALERGRDRSVEAAALAAAAKQAASALQGRALLRGEAHALLGDGTAAHWSGVLQLAQLLGWLRMEGSVAAETAGRRRSQRQCRCRRCGSGEAQMHRTPCAACGRLCAYCTACLNMGRSRECELLLLGMPRHPSAKLLGATSTEEPLSRSASLSRWGLSPAQTAAATQALRFIESPPPDDASPRFLLWAVTGAGKTEMFFPLVESVLSRGGKALIATPRGDVVLELQPRIRKAFPSCSVVTLYGGSEERWEAGDITLSTTHQLMRFHHLFDLVIIDELDAFPYRDDQMLHYAAAKSGAPGAPRLLLTATPSSELQRQARSGILPHARVPVRYHRHPLPVPSILRTPTVSQMISSARIPHKLLTTLEHSIHRGAQLFLFVQRIAQVEPFARLLRQLLKKRLKQSEVAGTSSKDEHRAANVQKFRSGEIRLLVTTTILERGVTIPRSDVYILDADGKLFDEASLVQMAGRAGRSAEDPRGLVRFCAKERTRSQVAAIRHIRKMNKIAAKNGYLQERQPPPTGY
ncbi:helicase-related protein [Paenibacillus sp. NPDC058071]|uniref:helicase-related protein n=1 Tax=Paenibacillus sp. NPDC058071 TaxID=3346326 RepID=UPI0036D90BC5